MREELLDDFGDVSGWSAVASGEAQLALARDAGPGGAALRLDFDFRGGGGFVVARKSLPRTLPAVWALALRIRGAAPANKLEVKLADPTNRNVWWWHRDAFAFPADWQPLRIRSSEVAFAWGPAGGGALRELGALEIAITAGPGGRGSVWIADLRLEDLSLAAPPRASASSSAPGCGPEGVVVAAAGRGWRSEPGKGPQWLALDFGQEHEYGGLVIDWGEAGAARAFEVQAGDEGAVWTTRWSARQAEGERSYVYLPGGGRSHRLRIHLLEPAAGAGAFAIRRLDVRPFEFSRSLADFFHAVAAGEPRGAHPRWLHREQSYWTPAGVAGATTAAILNEEGLLEPDRGSFSLEPFLYADGELVTWADATIELSLAQGRLPIPSSTWRWRDLELTTTAFALAAPDGAAARVRYRLANRGSASRSASLFVALRPFQVTPPWQAYQGLGGTAPIRSLAWRDGAVAVDGARRVVPLVEPVGFGAAAFEQGGVLPSLARGELPPRTEVADDFAHASGALCWDLALAPGATADVELAVPFAARPALGPVARGPGDEATTLEQAIDGWSRALGRVRIRLAGDAGTCIDALHTAAGHILANRDGPALQPGPRRYTRSWIRDGATMSAALLRMGFPDAVRDFLAWYAGHQAADGNVPCAVDRHGPDWLPEHDSHGQLVFTLAEHFRFSGDAGFASTLWPAALRAVGYLERLRATRCTPAYREPGQRARFGILPESVSHEGYLAQPVHAYWDDFWALRGIADAAELACALDAPEVPRLEALRDALGHALYASIETTIAERGLAYVPGSVEWADFDPTATATAIATTDAGERLPAGPLAHSFDEYLAGLRRRRDGEIEWNNYSAYEIRILGALVRLGRRADAHELLAFFLGDRRPRAWNQWPEISWRDPRSPGHLGDVPHAWIGAEYVLAVLAMFAHERPHDGALVLAAGVSEAWLDAGEIAVEGLPTWWGPLGYTIRRSAPNALRLELAAGLRSPPGGIVLRPPLPRPLVRASVDGAPAARFDAEGVTLRAAPARVELAW